MRLTKTSLTATACGLFLIAVCAPEARAALVYENFGGADLLYDTSTGATWTRNGDISGQTFTFQDANAWAAGLTTAGLRWELPTVAEFTSLFTELSPYGPPGTQTNKYGANVPFGAGPNDSAVNVRAEYWTSADGIDFNFFYGYGGGHPDTNLYAAWAVETPEPSPFPLLLASLAAIACFRSGWSPTPRTAR